MGIFDSLNIGYSGLSSSQDAINVTSHNISNQNTPGYSKQRVEQKVKYPIDDRTPGSVGSGVYIDTIKRVHDEYIYARYRNSNSSLEYAKYKEDTLKEVSDLFPDIEELGISQDIRDFFDSWSDLSQDPDNKALKTVVANNTIKLTSHIKDTNQKLENIKDKLNEEFKDGIEKINDLAKQIVDINKKISKIENVRRGNANDLRDQRDELELQMNKLINISVYKGSMHPDELHPKRTDMGIDYNINIAGHNIVDGVTYHPIQLGNSGKFFTANYYSHDNSKIDFTSKIRGGKLGAIVELRGSGIDDFGKAIDSKIQEYQDDLNTFSKGLIQKTNSLYAKSAQIKIQSDPVEFSTTSKLADIEGIDQGDITLVVYNNQGDEVAKRTIFIDANTTLDGANNSIVSQINENKDDNNDNDATNDLDDIYQAKVLNNTLVIEPKDGKDGYFIALDDTDTNFAGYMGLHKFFDGKNAKDIDLNYQIKEDVSNLQSFNPPVDGNNDFANDMVDLQYQKINFYANNTVTNETINGFYQLNVTKISTDATNATIEANSADSLNKSITNQFLEVSGVNLDEELTNLMKYQTAYQASAKVITTIDQMINTLLGMKQ